MGVKRVHSFGILLLAAFFIFCMLVTGLSQESRVFMNEEDFFQEIDENTAEQVWIHCRKELEEIAKTINDFNLYSNDNPKQSRKTLVQNVFTDLPPQLKRTLLRSLKSEKSPSHVSDQDKCQECLSKLYVRNVHPTTTPKRRTHLSSESSHKHSSFQDSIRLDETVIRRDLKSQKKPPNHVLLIGIVVSTAVASLALFVLLLFCCLGGDERKGGSEFAGNDEKPIVDLCPGSISGACQTSQAEGNKDLLSSFDMNNSSGNAAFQTPEDGKLPLPPGRTATLASSSSRRSPAAPPPVPPKPPAPKAPPPPPPRSNARPPEPPKPGNMKKPLGPRSTSGDENDPSGSSNSSKSKLKPFFWEKMNMSPNQSMVWDEVKAGSFQLNEEMMESLFGYASQNQSERGKSSANLNSQPKLIQIIDPKKAQNLAITLKALNVTTTKVCYALKEGTELPVELISTLIKMAPTQEEELKLRLYNGDLTLLGPAERFLKVVVEIPFVYKRLEALLFMSSLHEESSPLKDAFVTLEVACTKLKNSRLFLKLLEAVLKTGNRMNVGTYRGGAQAIKLDTLLKLSDVKGTDGKTTLLTFVVQEISRSEGTKAAQTKHQESSEYCRKIGLEVVSQLSKELHDVTRAAVIDGDHITSTVVRLGSMLSKTKDLINDELSSTEEAKEFCVAFNGFLEHADTEIKWMFDEEKRIMALVKSTGDYFHGNSAKDEGLRLFVIVRDFLKLLDKVCTEIWKTDEINRKKKNVSAGKIEALPREKSQQHSWLNIRDKLFPALKEQKMDYSSSDDDEDMSP
nr:formin-like protein 3 [Tanacetum cinerariifolium]